jgi:serine/threonine protein phosphatase PrpC
MSAEFMDSFAPEMLQNREKSTPTTENVLPIIKSSDSPIAEHEEIETFQATNVSMLCLKCSNYVNLKSLQDHRTLHEALALFQYDFQAKPTSEQALSRKRAALIKDLNKVLNISRSAYRKELGKIDLAYEVIKSAICGRLNKVKPSFIEHHDVMIRSVRAKLHEGVALGVCESTNEKWKSVMEDAYSYMYQFSEGRSVTYFAVFDGYSGATAAKQCARQFYQILKETLNDFNFNECIKDIDHCQLLGGFHQAFDNMDKVLLHGTNETSRNRWSGCSASTCVLIDNTLHVANVGNVKAALINDDDSFQTLTEDHTPANKKEKHRIKASGDIHKCSKTLWVNGVAMTTRGLGNHGDPLLKSSIINVPAVSCVPLADSQIILVASCSFWQVFNENEAVLLIKEWLKGNELGAAGNSVNSDKSNCSVSIKINIIQSEDSLKTESSDTINQLDEGETVGNNNFNASETGNHTNLNENKCTQCLNINNATCNCVSNGQDSLPSNTSDMNEQDTTSSTQPIEQKEGSLSKLLRDLVMRYDTDLVAVEISKHLIKAALSGGAKENITVMIVIPYNVVTSNNSFTSQ